MLEWRDKSVVPDLIILDMRMPIKSDGLTNPQMGLLLLSASFQLFPRTTPVVIYTGYDSYDDCVSCIKLGAHDYIPKVMEGMPSMDLLKNPVRFFIDSACR
jgi:DNA-binding NarL/FixJ family response regulator